MEVCGPQEAQHGLGWAAVEHNIVLYADDGHIAGRNPIWVQMKLTVVFRMFDRVGIHTNLINIKSMVCTPVFTWGQQVIEAYKRVATRKGGTFR